MHPNPKDTAKRLKDKFGDLSLSVVKEILKVVSKPWSIGYWENVKSELTKQK